MDKFLQIILGENDSFDPDAKVYKTKPVTKISANLEPEHIASIHDVAMTLGYDQTKSLKLLIEAGWHVLNGELGIGDKYPDILENIYDNYGGD